MTDRPAVVAMVLAVGALALVYNVWTYSQLFRTPNSSVVPEEVWEEAAPTEADGELGDARDASAVGAIRVTRSAVERFVAGLAVVDRNPFFYAGSAVAPTTDAAEDGLPRVLGIFRGEGRSVAWINGRAVSEGEIIDGYLLEKVEEGYVILMRDGREHLIAPAR